jgi:glycosyltransferase involved in cell wall biosynthesis
VSVALCTYNGAAYLPAQLDSLARQDRLPDELVVCDDGSTDGTTTILESFAAAAPFEVRWVVNNRTLGVAANFEQAIQLCRGDVIATCDQDDVWRPGKLARLVRAMRDAPDAGLAFSDAAVVGRDGRPTEYTLWDAIRFRPVEQRQFAAGEGLQCLLRRDRVTGATMAFRAAYRELICPIPPGWLHDAWIALLIAAVARCVLVAEPLIAYRQHPAQQIGGTRRTLLDRFRTARAMTADTFRATAAKYAAARDRLGGHPGVSPVVLRALAAKVRHAESRAAMRATAWRLPRVLGELRRGHYARFSQGWQAAAQDLFLG